SRDDLIKPFLRTTVDGLDIMGDPSVDRLTIDGPYTATGSGDTPSRRKIFTCRPPSSETSCTSRREGPADEAAPASAKASARSRRSSRDIEASEDGCAT